MKIRPCIDLHEGQVKQIVGSTLSENDSDRPIENFVSNLSAAEYAEMYQRDSLYGGHIIMLGKGCEEPTKAALKAFPGGMQVGGGITVDNALQYLESGASHVIVTSFMFNNGEIDMSKLQAISQLVGKDRLVIDLSCRKLPSEPTGDFYVVTNKWTKFTNFRVTVASLRELSEFCSEFLVHGVDVEGKRAGIDVELVRILGEFSSLYEVPVTYAGGVRSIEDLELVRRHGRDTVDCTVGSALDIFGGDLSYTDVLTWHRAHNLV